MRKILHFFIVVLVVIELFNHNLVSQNSNDKFDSIKKTQDLLNEAKVKSAQRGIEIIIRNVDISEYPIVKVIVEAYNTLGYPLDTLYADNLTVLENGVEKKVISVEKISVHERVPVDFLFAIDKTGSMQKYIDAVQTNISSFASSLIKRGIDYNLGLILFSDYVENKYKFTDNVTTFLSWLKNVKAVGGFDEKENALEAIEEACKFKYRPVADKVLVLITDAPYHQAGEHGEGVTDETTGSIIKLMKEKNVRLFSIVPPKLRNYRIMSEKTRGNFYDIDYPFSTVLDNFSNQLTSIYALKYRTDKEAIPDSINIALLDEKKHQLVRRIIPIVELGRKFIIENLLYPSGSSELPDSIKELDVLINFMQSRPNIVILVEGHTDDRGSNALNDRLSLLRANSVKNYLINKGIKSSRIKTKGYGERKPIASNKTAWGRHLNRRTEIVIVSK